MRHGWKPGSPSEALAELRAIADESNRIRHPFQNIYPVWKGLPLDQVLRTIADALETRL